MCGPRGDFNVWSYGGLRCVVLESTSLCGLRGHFTMWLLGGTSL